MNLKEIKQAIEDNKIVCVGSEAYQIIKDSEDQYFIECKYNNSCIGLTWLDDVTLNCKESDVFINDRY